MTDWRAIVPRITLLVHRNINFLKNNYMDQSIRTLKVENPND